MCIQNEFDSDKERRMQPGVISLSGVISSANSFECLLQATLLGTGQAASAGGANTSVGLGSCRVRDDCQGLPYSEEPEQVPLHFLLNHFYLQYFVLLTFRRNLDFQQLNFCSFWRDYCRNIFKFNVKSLEVQCVIFILKNRRIHGIP